MILYSSIHTCSIESINLQQLFTKYVSFLELVINNNRQLYSVVDISKNSMINLYSITFGM